MSESFAFPDPAKTLVENILGRLAWSRFLYNDEAALQRQISEAFTNYEFRREHELHPYGRVDFFFPRPKSYIGIAFEVKVQGSPSAVLRQVSGYSQHANVDEIVVVTGKINATALLPEELNGKKVHVYSLWRSLI